MSQGKYSGEVPIISHLPAEQGEINFSTTLTGISSSVVSLLVSVPVSFARSQQ